MNTKKLFLFFIFFNHNFLSTKDHVISQKANLLNTKKMVFLTGAAGFIGSNFLEYMFEKYPYYHFLVLDSLTYAGNLKNIPKHIRKSNRFEFFYGSINSFYHVDLLMSRADLVVHFAAESHVTRSIVDDASFFDTDVMGTRVMMKALVKYKNKVQRFIHISTSEVCGTAENNPMDENHSINPRSPYAAAKAGADRLVFSYCCTYNVPALIFRPFNNYGPKQHLEKVIPRFIKSALTKKPLTVHGTGLQARDYMHTSDLCRALDIALHIKNFTKIKGQVIHVGTGVSISILDIAKLILKYFDLPETYIKFVGDRPGQVQYHRSSTKKAKKLLNWKAQIPFSKGIDQTIEWYLQNKKSWKKIKSMEKVPIYINDNVTELQ